MMQALSMVGTAAGLAMIAIAFRGMARTERQIAALLALGGNSTLRQSVTEAVFLGAALIFAGSALMVLVRAAKIVWMLP